MSDDAKTLMYWVNNWRDFSVADDSDREYCARCAFNWAAHIIGA